MDEQKLSEMYDLTKENNKMLKAMRRDAFVGGIVKFIFWIIVFVVIPYLTWLYVQPYLQGFLDTYQKVQQTADSVSSSTTADFSQFQEFLKKFGINPSEK
ncbi:MAG: hypothetical protein V4449_01915 [Patescibacteria group bacterium]